MKKVLKYKLRWHNEVVVKVFGKPTNICCVNYQERDPYVWIEVEEDNSCIQHSIFIVYATGMEIPLNMVYAGTIHHQPTGTVWHVYYTPFKNTL